MPFRQVTSVPKMSSGGWAKAVVITASALLPCASGFYVPPAKPDRPYCVRTAGKNPLTLSARSLCGSRVV